MTALCSTNEGGYPEFVAIGEALTDMVIQDPVLSRWVSKVGGSTWNVARAYAALGGRSAFAGAISTDVFGDALWMASKQAGLDLRFLQRLDKAPLMAMVYETDPPRYFFIGENSADLHFDPELLPPEWPKHAQWAHFGGISLAREPLATRLVELAGTLKKSGVHISYDPNYRSLMHEGYDATLQQMVRLADVVKVSDEDLIGLFRTSDLEDALNTLRSWNPEATVLFTRGAMGASLHLGRDKWHDIPPTIDVVDTVGAGDASIAGLVFSLMRNPDADSMAHLRFSIAAGAAACLSVGASPPRLMDVMALL